MLTLDRLTDIIAQSEQLDAEDKTVRRNMAVSGLTENIIAKMKGEK